MKYPMPKPMNVTQLKSDVSKWEKKKFKSQTSTLSAIIDDSCFVQAWDVAELSAVDLAIIHDHFSMVNGQSVILINLKV